MWKLLKPFICKGTSKSSDPIRVKWNGSVISDPKVLANHFNDYFIDTVNRSHSSFSQSQNHVNVVPVVNDGTTFEFDPVDIKTMSHLLKRIKKSSHSKYSIPPKLIQACIQPLACHFMMLHNTFITLCQFPDQWKLAYVIPVHKKGSLNDIANYRPISILPNISKAVERILYNQILKFVNDHNLLSKCQYGFRPGHSTSGCCLDLLNFICTSIDKGYHVGAIFLDLSKAFDMISHDILFKKLTHMGFSLSSIKLLKSYLQGRTQKVSMNNHFSDEQPITYGVPQGSILGSLLFLIYINDIDKHVSHSEVFLFADDSTLVCAHKNANTLVQFMNYDLQNISNYCNSNKLILNASKTKSMFFFL